MTTGRKHCKPQTKFTQSRITEKTFPKTSTVAADMFSGGEFQRVGAKGKVTLGSICDNKYIKLESELNWKPVQSV